MLASSSIIPLGAPLEIAEMIDMNRRELLGFAGAMSACSLTCQAQVGQEHASPPKENDPWIGTYLKYARYDTGRTGQFGEALTITISKDRDGYSMSKPYANAHFKEKTKGVLSDRDGGLGKIYLGFVEYADGKKDTILRVEFCYEDFVLYREVADETAKTPQPGDKE